MPIRPLRSLALGVTIAGMAACSRGTDESTPFRHFSVLDGAHVALHARASSDATLGADGSLRIGGREQTTTPPQREQLKGLYADVLALQGDALATGKAGAATAREALGSVVSGLASGSPDRIGPAIDAKAAVVEANVQKLCADLASIRTRQHELAAALPDFRPYATLGDDGDCKRD